MATNNIPWYKNLKNSQIIGILIGIVVIILIILQRYGYFTTKEEHFRFSDGSGDTDKAALKTIEDSNLLDNIEDNVVANRPISNLPPSDITHGDVLMSILDEAHVMVTEEIAEEVMQNFLEKTLKASSALKPTQHLTLMSDNMVKLLADTGIDMTDDVILKKTMATVSSELADIVTNPSLLKELPADNIIYKYIIAEVGEDASEKAIKAASKRAMSNLSSGGAMKMTSLSGAIYNLTAFTTKTALVTLPMTIGKMILFRKGINFAAKKAAMKSFVIVKRQALKMALTRVKMVFAQKSMMVFAKFLLSMSIGPIGWALEAIGIVGTIFDMWDPNNESDREDPKDYNEAVSYIESRSAIAYKTGGHKWPPIAPVQRFFPEEMDQSFDDVYSAYQDRAVAHIMDHPEDDIGLTALVLKMTHNIPDRVFQDEILSKVQELSSETIQMQYDKFAALIRKMMENSPQYRESIMYGALVRHITENSNREYENMKTAPFWYFAMSIPTAAYTGAINVDDIPVAKRGINYSNLTIHDIKISDIKEEYGKKFIDIYRAKVPYTEERVRAYEIKEEQIKDDIGTLMIPEMPDIDEVKQRTAEYHRYRKKGAKDNMISQAISKKFGSPTELVEKSFGFRDESSECIGCRAQSGAHSKWLSMCVFQQFLLELAQHTGVHIDMGPDGAAYNNGNTIVKKYGVFKWKNRYFRAFAPRPWHEPRFVSLDLRYVDTLEGSIYLNEVAAHRWNEVFEHQRTAGNVLYQFRNIPSDRIPTSPVAIWTKQYPDVYIPPNTPDDEHPTPLATRMIETLEAFKQVYKKNGRLYFVKYTDARLVKIMSEHDYNKINNNFKDKKQGWAEALRNPNINLSILDYNLVGDELKANQFYKIKLGGSNFIFYNGNTTGINNWLKKDKPVIKKKSDVEMWPYISNVKEYIKRDFVNFVKNEPNGMLLDTGYNGLFDAEILIHPNRYTDLIWTNIIGIPNPRIYPHDIPHIKPGETKGQLRVGIYKISVVSADEQNYGETEECYFTNYDGNVNPKWQPHAIESTISDKRMMFLGIHRLYQWCTKGMENDDSMALHAKDGHGRMTLYDDNQLTRYQKDPDFYGIYENYRVHTKSGVPHAKMNWDGNYISFNDWYEETSYGRNYIRHAWQTFDHDTRRCYVKNEKAARHYCKQYMGETWHRIATYTDDRDNGEMYTGECKLQTWTLLFTFIVGENLIRMANRG